MKPIVKIGDFYLIFSTVLLRIFVSVPFFDIWIHVPRHKIEESGEKKK